MKADNETYRKVYSILDAASPLKHDCGSLCGSVCCKGGSVPDEELYIYLLPGEMEFLKEQGADIELVRRESRFHYLPHSWGKHFYTAICRGPENCPRSLRPIQCRTFPLEPHMERSGELKMIYCDIDLPYECPLISKKMVLDEKYVYAIYEAWHILIEDDLIRDLVRMDSAGRKKYDVYPYIHES
ncbi:MAG: hypothetical protein K6F73_10965 [Lachnospiraceae bacterium]|nr:hypothetical protein [Lachnospiraceae bacterium]